MFRSHIALQPFAICFGVGRLKGVTLRVTGLVLPASCDHYSREPKCHSLRPLRAFPSFIAVTRITMRFLSHSFPWGIQRPLHGFPIDHYFQQLSRLHGFLCLLKAFTSTISFSIHARRYSAQHPTTYKTFPLQHLQTLYYIPSTFIFSLFQHLPAPQEAPLQSPASLKLPAVVVLYSPIFNTIQTTLIA